MELFDLYTPERVLTGKSMVRGDRLPDGLWRLVVRIAVFGDDGRMLIHRYEVVHARQMGYERRRERRPR